MLFTMGPILVYSFYSGNSSSRTIDASSMMALQDAGSTPLCISLSQALAKPLAGYKRHEK